MSLGTLNSNLATLDELFDNPLRDFSPTPLWWWSAEKVTKAEIKRQLAKLRDGGIYNVVVINLAPSGPLFGAVVDDPIWFSEEWFARFDDMCVEAAALDMRVWFYDQIGFSGANIQGKLTEQNPWAAGKSLKFAEVELREGGRIDDAAIDNDRIVGVYGPADAEYPHGRPREHANGLVANGSTGEIVRVISWRPTAFDYLNVDAVALLLDLVHGEFERRMGDRLGNVIAGSFQDELPATNSWTTDFAESFETAFGYDLLAVLPAVFRPDGAEGAAILHDYFAHRTALTERALFEPLGLWHKNHGMLLGADQFNPARAGWPTQATQLYSDYFRTHRHYNAAGSDHEGDSKVHSSMSHLYDNDRTWIESFHSSGWGGTLQDTYDWLLPFLRSGANLYNPHAVYFGLVGGWFEWAPPSTDWRQPYWKQYKSFADCVARISSILTWGSHSCSVAVLHPTTTAQSTLVLDSPIDHFKSGQLGSPFAAADEAQRVYLELCGTNNWWRTNPGALNEAAVDFDVIDDSSIQAADSASGALQISDERYRVVILPSTEFLESATASALIDLLNAGGRVIVVGNAPTALAGTEAQQSLLAELIGHPGLERFATAALIAEALKQTDRVLGSELASLVRTNGRGTSVAFIPAAQPNASAYPLRTGESWFWDDYDFDSARYAESASVALPGATDWVEAWNPATGQRVSLDFVVGTDGAAVVDVPFGGAPALLVVWGTGDRTPSLSPTAPSVGESEVISLDGGWTGEIVHTLENSHGEFDRPARAGFVDDRIWKLSFGESADSTQPDDWQPTRATFGVHGEVSGPSTDGVAPSFTPWAYSLSRGIEKDPSHKGLLGAKGRVPDAFVVAPASFGEESSRFRAFVKLPAPGEYELYVGATAAKRVWLDGELIVDDFGLDDAPYLVRASVVTATDIVHLEYELGAAEGSGGFMASGIPEIQGSLYAFTRPGAWPEYPEYMRPVDTESRADDREIRFTRTVLVEEAVDFARIVVGAACALGVYVDGELCGRQEMAEYYESDWGAAPQYFVHDLTSVLSAGEHVVEIRCETANPNMVLFVDLVMVAGESRRAIVSGAGWDVGIGSVSTTTTVPTRSGFGEVANTHVVRRPHPLPLAQWLSGDPEIGATAVVVEATDSLELRSQWIRMTLPSGTTTITIPSRLALWASVDGAPVVLTRHGDDHVVILDAPLAAAAHLQIVTEPTAFSRGGAALLGPVGVTVENAPIELGAWPTIGLDWLSGGLRYSRNVEIAHEVHTAILDLGSLRGHVTIEVNGQHVADLFCTPWSWNIAPFLHTGSNEIVVEVYNTLGPYFDDISPTPWVFPSQKLDGLFGPVSLSVSYLSNQESRS